MFSVEKSKTLCYITAVKEESDDEEWRHGQCKSETKEPRCDELGSKLEKTFLTDKPLDSTNSPKSKSHNA